MNEDRIYRLPTLEELKPGTPIYEAIAQAFEDWAPNYMDDSDRVTSYGDWIDRVEGVEDPGDPTCNTVLEFGPDECHPVYLQIRKIAKQVAREIRGG